MYGDTHRLWYEPMSKSHLRRISSYEPIMP